jgi:NAD(P)-dependent dehydrogenase (short-subunit alcohol dehydrogenase family)
MPAPTPAVPLTTTLRHDVYSVISPAHTLAGSAAGLCVVITGAGRGIGRAQALAFAQAGAARVIIGARSAHELDEVEQAIHALGGKTEVVKAVLDVTDEESVARAFAHAGDVNGADPRDSVSCYMLTASAVLVNNAGYSEPWKRIHEADPAQWWKAWDVNIRGTFLPTRAALQAALARPERPVQLTVINTSSIGSVKTRPGASAYQNTKTAVNRFTEFLHFEYEVEGVRTFALHPGMFRGDMSRSSPLTSNAQAM